MKNSYTISGDGKTVTIWLRRRKGERLACLIDAVDLPKVDSIPNRWRACWDPQVQSFYVASHARVDQKNVGIRIHRLITDAPRGLYVDHLNHETLDNRRENLQVTTPSGNGMNRHGANRDSKSGHRGISPCFGKFQLRVTINGKVKYIGLFSTLDEAIAVRDKFPGYGKKHLGHSSVL